MLAADVTERIELGTGIAVAFARNPMSMAMVANDVHRFSEGRLLLGLGSQIEPHIEKRFSMPWSKPAARMREYIAALRAIWSAWNDGTKLAFRGDFYTHTLMTPMFSPRPNPFGAPKVLLAAVGTRMTEVAGEMADGMLVHGFTTEHYLREVTLPAVERGLAAFGSQPRRLRPVVSRHGGDRRHRGAAGDGGPGGEVAARLLRIDAGVPAGPRPPWMGRAAR